MNRRQFVTASSAALVGAAARGDPLLEELELSLEDIAAQFGAGQLTALQLTDRYLDRIQRLNRDGPDLRAILEINPRAREIAISLDLERKAGAVRGALHGIPILIKDNIETRDGMMSTAGSLALEHWVSPIDAPLVKRLRDAGAVILGKTNLSEWANFRSYHAISGWSARGGQTRNPYALNRSPSGSSSGSAVAVAANLCALAVGTETNGSIVSPASVNGIVGLKPTLGLVSRRGIAPISHSQDTAGCLTRSVRDAAVLLTILAAPDVEDLASAPASRFDRDYTRHLDANGLQGARLGIARRFFEDNAPLDGFLSECIRVLRDAGAVIVDPADLPLHHTFGASELEVLLYEFKADLNTYLSRLPNRFPVHSLTELIRFNEANREQEMPLFGQEIFLSAERKGPLTEAAYLNARAACLNATRHHGIDEVVARYRLDAMVTLTSTPAGLIDQINGDADSTSCSGPAAIAGYPHITVPAGLHRGLPVGLSFFGTAFTEPKLFKIAYAFERAARARVPPRYLSSI